MDDTQMKHFWDARAREDAFYFVDNRQAYKSPDLERFWGTADAVDALLDDLSVSLRPSDSVLEIGCGLGRITRALAARAGEVVALDVSEEMLGRAQHLNAHLEGVRWVLGDGVSLAGIPDASVDACMSLFVFQHIPDPAITLTYVREVGRVLRPGGWAALQVSNDPEFHRPKVRVRTAMKALTGRGPKGQKDPAWLGSSVELHALRDAAHDGGMKVEAVRGRGALFCPVLLRKGPSPGTR